MLYTGQVSYVRQATIKRGEFMEGLSIDLAEGSPPVLYVRGELDMATAGQLRAAIDEAVCADADVLVDLGGVTFVDLSGVRAILDAAHARNGQGPVKLVHAPRVAWILDLLGVDEHAAALEIYRCE
jgi:anti-sigma B factor antagonist